MKNLFFISILMTTLLSFSSMTVSANSIHPDKIHKEGNFLKVKGDIVDVKADIQVFEYNSSIGDWECIREYCNKSKYSLYLNPTKNYQVWFSNVTEGTKVLHIDAGSPGPWMKYLDIDFSTKYAYARIYQDYPIYDYIVEMVDNTYSSIAYTEHYSANRSK